MKSTHKTDTHFYFIIQQLTFNKSFKCDCAGRKKKHGFSTFQKWQIWPKFPIVKTSWYRRNFNMKQGLYWSVSLVFVCVFVPKMFLAAFQTCSVDRPRTEVRVFWQQESSCNNKQVSTLGILILYRKHIKLLRHLNPIQSFNDFRLYLGVSVRFNMIPVNWFLQLCRSYVRNPRLLYF